MSNLARAIAKDLEAWRPGGKFTAYALHQRGHRTIAAVNWCDGSYLQLSDSLPIRYSVHGAARGQYQPSARDHVPGVRPYSEYFGRAIWVPARVGE